MLMRKRGMCYGTSVPCTITKVLRNTVLMRFGPRRPDTFGGEGVSEEKILSILKDIHGPMSRFSSK